MKFKTGHKKVGGRQKGTPNKTTLLREALNDFNFGDEFSKNYEELSSAEKMQVLRWVADYFFVKPKPDDATTDDLEKALEDVVTLIGHRKERDGE